MTIVDSAKYTLAWMVSLAYPKLANIKVTQYQVTETINGWTINYMIVHVEERQDSEYFNKDCAESPGTHTRQHTKQNRLNSLDYPKYYR